jgi:hypothetical protein
MNQLHDIDKQSIPNAGYRTFIKGIATLRYASGSQ